MLASISRLLIGSFLLAASPALAAEGGATSGGGGAHVCLNRNGGVRSAELYDLYEGRELYRLPMITDDGRGSQELLDYAFRRIWTIDPWFADRVEAKLKLYIERRAPKSNTQFETIRDADIVMMDKGCQYQQVAQWRDRYKAVFIDEDLNAVFGRSPLNRAALALHEAVYAVRREDGETTSDNSRKIVARAFSTGPMLEAGEAGDPKQAQIKHAIPFDPEARYSARLRLVWGPKQGIPAYAADTYHAGKVLSITLSPSQDTLVPLKVFHTSSKSVYSTQLVVKAPNTYGVIIEILKDGVAIPGIAPTSLHMSYPSSGGYASLTASCLFVLPYEGNHLDGIVP